MASSSLLRVRPGTTYLIDFPRAPDLPANPSVDDRINWWLHYRGRIELEPGILKYYP